MEGYPNYKKKLNKWNIFGDDIIPKQSTISEMKIIIEKYGHPTNPSENKWTFISINYKGLPSNSISNERRKLECITNRQSMIKRNKICHDQFEQAKSSHSEDENSTKSNNIDESILKLNIYQLRFFFK